MINFLKDVFFMSSLQIVFFTILIFSVATAFSKVTFSLRTTTSYRPSCCRTAGSVAEMTTDGIFAHLRSHIVFFVCFFKKVKKGMILLNIGGSEARISLAEG